MNALVPRVSPMVTMALCWTTGSPVSLESITARCGLQSPHFSLPQHWEENITIRTLSLLNHVCWCSGCFTVATAGTLPDSSWKMVWRGSLGVSWPVNLPEEHFFFVTAYLNWGPVNSTNSATAVNHKSTIRLAICQPSHHTFLQSHGRTRAAWDILMKPKQSVKHGLGFTRNISPKPSFGD